jgi:hypothetical protein
MRASVNQRGYTLSGLTSGELNIVMFLLGHIKSRCFTDGNYDKELGKYLDGDNFTACIDKKERDDLYRFVDGFWREYDKIKERLSWTNKK